MCVGARVGDDDEAGFFEGAGDIVGKITRRESSGNGDGTGMSGEFENSTLTVGTSRDDGNVGRVIDRGDDAGCKDDFFPVQIVNFTERVTIEASRVHSPSFPNIDHVDSIGAGLPEVWLHVNLQILRANVTLC